MELKPPMMIFTHEEQRFGGIAESSHMRNAERIKTRVSEVLQSEIEKQVRLGHADDDEITQSERAELPSIAHKINVLRRLDGQLFEVQTDVMVGDVESYLRLEDL